MLYDCNLAIRFAYIVGGFKKYHVENIDVTNYRCLELNLFGKIVCNRKVSIFLLLKLCGDFIYDINFHYVHIEG